MIYSMTGYGEAQVELNGKTYRIEIKSLNGKTTDIRFKSSISLREKELILRKMITELGIRGKFDVNFSVNSSNSKDDSQINQDAMQSYYNELVQFSKNNNLSEGDILQTLVRLPNVVQINEESLNDEEWKVLETMTRDAVTKLNKFRATEGNSLTLDLNDRVANIQSLLKQVDPHDKTRIEFIKERIKKNLNQHLAEEQIDENRFEQEILFYLEKLDLNEEKVRLNQHCDYFLSELQNEKIQKGKKLNFISQEMGREINTLGAKAQNSTIQQLVVGMKDELEKIKEQVLNIL